MGASINIDFDAVKSNASEISKKAGDLTRGSLTPTDGRSTISANSHSQTEFVSSQDAIVSMSAALTKMSQNITAFGKAHKDNDDQHGRDNSQIGR